MRNFFTSDQNFKNPLFIGTVEDNNDPTQNYRVKVRIEKMHTPNITTEQLPWAARVDTAFMGMGDSQDLAHSIPEIGTKVLLLAVGNDINSLVYIGCLYKKTAQTPSGGEYTGTYGVYRSDGQFIGVDKIAAMFKLLFQGDVEIDQVLNMNINVKTNIDTKCTNNNLTCTNVTVKATKVDSTGKHTINGDTVINGNVIVNGTITSTGSIVGAGVGLSSHQHGYLPGPGPLTDTTPGVG